MPTALDDRINELLADTQAVMDEQKEIEARFGGGGFENRGDWPSGQRQRWENLNRRFGKLSQDVHELEERRDRTEHARQLMQDPSNVERVDDVDRNTRTYATRRRSDPWRDIEGGSITRADTPDGLRERALDAIELVVGVPQASRQRIAELLGDKDDDDPYDIMQSRATAEFVMASAAPAYLRAFRKYFRDPLYGHRNWTPEEQAAWSRTESVRAALSLTTANGGALVPFTLDPTIILTNSGSANPFRQISTIKETATNTWNGVTSAGVNAGWLAEGTEDTDHSPTFGQLQITPQKASAWVFGSYEVLGDSDFAVQFPNLMADAKDRLEEAAFATGTGSGQPFGVVPRATTVNSLSAGAYAVGDVYGVQQALPARFRGAGAKNAWVANLNIINKTRQFDTAGGSSFWTNLGQDSPERVLGKPLYESTTMVGTITTGSKNLLYGDFSQYFIVDRIGMNVLYEPMVKGTANARPTGQAGWLAFWRVGADVSTSSAFRVLVET